MHGLPREGENFLWVEGQIEREITEEKRMGLFASLDTELQKDLLNFVEEREKQPWPRKMGDELLTSVLKDIIKGPCSITGWARKGNKCWMELTWNFDKNDQKKSEEDGTND